MEDRNPVTEIDLLAYADGLLDEDPVRKGQVEARLRHSPEDAARVRAYQAQTEALRRRYGYRVEEPVPERLYAALRGAAGRPARHLRRAAAVLLLIAIASGSGLLIGLRNSDGDWSAQEFVERSYRSFVDSSPGQAVAPVQAQAEAAKPLQWLSRQVSLNVRAPDLSGLGYAMTDRETVTVAGDRMVRLTYTGRDGQSFSLFLRPRWEDQDGGLEVATRGNVSLAYWFDGPLASALAVRLPPEQARGLAAAIRRGMRAPAAPTEAAGPVPALQRGAPQPGGEEPAVPRSGASASFDGGSASLRVCPGPTGAACVGSGAPVATQHVPSLPRPNENADWPHVSSPMPANDPS